MTPKARFLKTPHSKTFADIALSEPFQVALDYALLEMQAQSPNVDDLAKGFTIHAKLLGALELRRVLESICLPEEPAKPQRLPTLNHDAYNKPARNG